jgi:hypothetical protein
MSLEERVIGLERVGLFLQKYGKLFSSTSTVVAPWHHSDSSNDTLHDPFACAGFGSGWGSHYLCGPAPSSTTSLSCNFISFGISVDYSFDVELAERWNCRGFAGDPSIVHPSQLHPKVTFHNVAASSLQALPNGWWSTSMPSLVKFLQLSYVHVLKMDCEGCEYALPRDVLLEDITLFHRIGQISLEVHVSKIWIDNDETLYYFGLLFELMEEAGLELAWSHLTSCHPSHEVVGCLPQFEQWGFSCGLQGNETHSFAQGNQRGSCHNFLFARRPPSVTTSG